MSSLYGSVQGNRGEATRCGSKASGMRVSAQSWNGSLITYMSLDKEGNPQVELRTSDNSSFYGQRVIFRGSLKELEKKLSENR